SAARPWSQCFSHPLREERCSPPRALAVDGSASRHPISPEIYGLNFADAPLVAEHAPPVPPRPARPASSASACAAFRRGRASSCALARASNGQGLLAGLERRAVTHTVGAMLNRALRERISAVPAGDWQP